MFYDNSKWDILVLKGICCLYEMQMSLGGLYFTWQPSRADWLGQSSPAFWRRRA